MKLYILIVVLKFYSSVTSIHQEFTSLEKCEAALRDLKNIKYNESLAVVGACYEK